MNYLCLKCKTVVHRDAQCPICKENRCLIGRTAKVPRKKASDKKWRRFMGTRPMPILLKWYREDQAGKPGKKEDFKERKFNR